MAQRLAVARRRVAPDVAGQSTARCGSGGGWSVLLLVPVPSAAQDEPRCVFLCAPELKIEPTWTIENLGAEAVSRSMGIVERVAA